MNEDTQDNGAEEVTEDTIVKAIDSVAGDLATWLIDRVRHLPKTWEQMTAEEQQGWIDAAQSAAEHAARQTVNIVAADGRKIIYATLGDGKIPSDVAKPIEFKITIPRSDAQRHVAMDHVGQRVLLVVADAAECMGGDMPEADPDQPSMLDEGDDDGAVMDGGQGFGSGEKTGTGD